METDGQFFCNLKRASTGAFETIPPNRCKRQPLQTDTHNSRKLNNLEFPETIFQPFCVFAP